jgi:hypothetical protein
MNHSGRVQTEGHDRTGARQQKRLVRSSDCRAPEDAVAKARKVEGGKKVFAGVHFAARWLQMVDKNESHPAKRVGFG